MDTSIVTPTKPTKSIPLEDVVPVMPLRTLNLDLKDFKDKKKNGDGQSTGQTLDIILGQQKQEAKEIKKENIIQNNLTKEQVQDKLKAVLEKRGQAPAPVEEEIKIAPLAPDKDAIALGGVIIEDDKVKIIYSKNFDANVYLMDENGSLVHNGRVFSEKGNNVQSVQPLRDFRIEPGKKVRLCHGNNNNICSAFVTVLGFKSEPAPAPSAAALVTPPKPVQTVSPVVPVTPKNQSPEDIQKLAESIFGGTKQFTTDSMKSWREKESGGPKKVEVKPEPEEKIDVPALKSRISEIDKERIKLQSSIDNLKAQKEKHQIEEKQITAKKDEIEKILSPILAEKRNIDDQIKKTEEDELVASQGDQKRKIEQKRWELEDARKKIEQKKWAALDDMQVTINLLDEVRSNLSKVESQLKDTTDKFDKLTQEREQKNLKVRLHDTREMNKEIESAIAKATGELERVESNLEMLSKQEQEIFAKKKDLEMRESLDSNVSEQKKMAEERWNIEAKLRQIEKERWEVEMNQAKAEKSVLTLKQGQESISRQEQEIVSKLQGF
jgi:hypothetical protein